MSLKKRLQNDEYFKVKIANIRQIGRVTKQNIGYLLGILALTFAITFGVYLTCSNLNTNAVRIEAKALSKKPHQLSEITLRSKINDGDYPNDIFAAPNDEILYLQENYKDIKIFKTYNAYENIRKTDWVNGFYYLGDETTKPPSTYYQPETRRYMDFLCLDNGQYLDIELLTSTNPKKDKNGNITGYQFLKQYIGNEIYLPYKFASEILLPKLQTGNSSLTINDLLNQSMTVYSITRDRYTVDDGTSVGNKQTEQPRTYIIKGIIKENTDELLEKYFIIPFRSELLTQPRLHFFATENIDTNTNFLSTIQKLNDHSSFNWGYQTSFSEAINGYVKSNQPAKRVGIFGTLTLILIVLDFYIFFLMVKSWKTLSFARKRSYISISTSIAILAASLLGSIFVSLISSWSLFSWQTSTETFSSCLFNETGSLFTCLLAGLLIIGAITLTCAYFKKNLVEEIDDEHNN